MGRRHWPGAGLGYDASKRDTRDMRAACIVVLLGPWIAGGCSLLFHEDAQSGPSSKVRVWSHASSNHTCATLGQKIACWGDNAGGQLGVGYTTSIGYTERADDSGLIGELDAEIVQVAPGRLHTCALTETRRAYCWGNGAGGALGNGDSLDRLSIEQVVLDEEYVPLADIMAIGASNDVTCALLADGTVQCWGPPIELTCAGETEACTQATVDSPNAIVDVGDAQSLAVGATHACVSLDDDQIQCWGSNNGGALGAGTSTTDFFVADPQISPLRKLATGHRFSCGIDDHQDVRCWGADGVGQLGLESNWASYRLDEASALGLAPVTKVVAGYAHACALLDSQKLLCWGQGADGALGQGSRDNIGDTRDASSFATLPLSGIVDVAAGASHTCAALDSGHVVCWGRHASTMFEGILGTSEQCDDLGDPCIYGDEGTEKIDTDTRWLFFDWDP